MPRLIQLAAATAALAAATPVLAADYLSYPELRPSYPDQWAYSEANPLRFEVGLRYWYSLGSQDFDVGAGAFSQSADTKTHSGEAFFRIDDDLTNSFLKGMAGYSFAMEGDYTNVNSTFTPDFTDSGAIYNGHLGYVGADFGYAPWGNENVQFGGLLGYLYWRDSPNTGNSYASVNSASDIIWVPGSAQYSVPRANSENILNIHALRLGVTGRAEFSELVDVTAEVAAVPYAYVSGTMGDGPTGPFMGSGYLLSSPVDLVGMGYGAMGELMVGIKPTENIAFHVGGRAWYLRGQTEATYSAVNVTGPQDTDVDGDYETAPTVASGDYTTTYDNPFEIFRYGLLAGVSVRF